MALLSFAALAKGEGLDELGYLPFARTGGQHHNAQATEKAGGLSLAFFKKNLA